LWNFSSIGGTIFLTFIRISRVACDIFDDSEDIAGNAAVREKVVVDECSF
jgi:hypothetical protein